MKGDESTLKPPLFELAQDRDAFLFRFRAFHSERDTDVDWQGYAASLLRDGLIYCASCREMNDPWEGLPAFSIPDADADPDAARRFVSAFGHTVAGGSVTPEQVGAWIQKEGYAYVCRALQHVYARNLGALGVLSLAGNCSEPLLWSHYADGHKGYCWIVDHRKRPFATSAKVTYVDQYPEIDWGDWKDEDVTRLSFFSKAHYWKHEDEYRLVVPVADNPAFPTAAYNGKGDRVPRGKYLRIAADALIGVVFGVNMSVDHKCALMELGTRYGHDLKYFQAGIHTRQYKVALKELRTEDLSAIVRESQRIASQRGE